MVDKNEGFRSSAREVSQSVSSPAFPHGCGLLPTSFLERGCPPRVTQLDGAVIPDYPAVVPPVRPTVCLLSAAVTS